MFKIQNLHTNPREIFGSTQFLLGLINTTTVCLWFPFLDREKCCIISEKGLLKLIFLRGE